MTTIAYRDGVMACDTLVTDGCRREGHMTKLFRLSNGSVAGFAGDAALAAEIIAWIDGAVEKPDLQSGESFDVIVAAPGRVEFIQQNFRRIEVTSEYYAIGSGVNFAYGAMAVGATAEQAVEAGIKHDVYSGGPIKVMRIGE